MLSHTRYRALGPELIPVYKQSARRWLLKSSPSVYMLPLLSKRPVVTFPAKERYRPSTSTKLYCLVTEAHRCEQLAEGCHAALSWGKLNPPPIDHKSQRLIATPLCHPLPPEERTDICKERKVQLVSAIWCVVSAHRWIENLSSVWKCTLG